MTLIAQKYVHTNLITDGKNEFIKPLDFMQVHYSCSLTSEMVTEQSTDTTLHKIFWQYNS